MDRWGFNGMIDTDRGALTFMVTQHKYYPNMTESVAGAIHAGVNQFLDSYQDAVKSAMQQKLITEEDIDRNLQSVLRVMIHLGFLDPSARVPYTTIKASKIPAPWDQQTSKALALHVTDESIVLLKNSSHLLPLDRSGIRSIAVVGPLANVVDSDGYGGTPPFAVTPLQGIQHKVGSRVAVHYSSDESQAAVLAKASDVAIVVVGNRPFCHKRGYSLPCPDPTDGQEGADRKDIHLKPDQEKLIRDVYAANPRTIVVLISSFPYTIDWTAQHIPAILHMAHSSEEEGNALADVIFGDYNPAGRLVVTWPQSITQEPAMMDYNLRDGRTYMYFKGKPLFPFGFGLSYTAFRYSNLRTSTLTLSSGKSMNVEVKVANTGQRSGDEVVQLYVQHIGSKVPRPRLELEGFVRMYVPAHESKSIEIPLHADALGYWDTSRKAWVLEKDKIKVMVGSSSDNLRLAKVITVQ